MWFVLSTVAAIFAGIFAAFLLIVLMEVFGSVVHPVPEGFAGTMEEMCLYVERTRIGY